MIMVLMNTFARTVLAAGSACLLCLTACGSPTADGGDGPSIIASFYPLLWATEQVVGDSEATVEVLTQPGGDAHGMELSPRQIASVGRADLVIYLDGLQPEVDAAVEETARRVLDVAGSVELAPITQGHSHEEGAQEHSEGDGHDHGDFDPHFWLDPQRMGKAVEAIAAELAELNPGESAAYRANAAAAVEELAAIDREFSAGLATCERREFITTHAAFGYLAQRYDLEEIGISGITPDSEPSPARIAEVLQEAERHRVTTIFFETLASPAVAEAIAGDLGLDIAVLDPLEGITENSPGDDYPAVMRANLDALRSANDCS